MTSDSGSHHPKMPWYEGHNRRERIADALRRNGFDVLLALTPENAAYLSGRTSTIATLWRIPGLVAVAVNRQGSMAVAAGDNEIGGYGDAGSRFAYSLWIEHLDLRRAGDLAARVRERVAAPRAGCSTGRHSSIRMSSSTLSRRGAGRRRFAAGSAQISHRCRAWLADGLRSRLPQTEWVEAGALFDDLRAIKDADEIVNLRLAAELTEIGIAAARDAMHPGLSAIGVTAAYQCGIWQRAAGDDRFSALRQVEGLVSVGDGSAPRRLVQGRR